jgi:multiple sugar transport system substrate-binding protein
MPLFLLLILTACDQAPPDTSPTRNPARGSGTAQATSTIRSTTVTPTSNNATATLRPESHLDIDPAALQDTEIVFWHIWNGALGEQIQQLVETFNANNEWGIKVQAISQDNLDQISTRVVAAMQEEEGMPDIAVGTAYQTQIWDYEQPLIDLSLYVQDPVWGLAEQDRQAFRPVFWQHEVLADGRRLAIPAQRSGQMLYYNLSWARELGFREPPQTAAEFERQACAAARANNADANPDNDGTGGWMISTDYSAMLGWIYAFGGQVYRESNATYRFDTPSVEQAFTFLRELYDRGCAWMPEEQLPEAEFAQRMGLFAAGSLTGIPFQQEAFDSAGNADEWSVIPFPGDADEPALTVYGTSYVVLPSTPSKQLAAWLFIRWLLEPENQAQWVQSAGSFPLQDPVPESMLNYAQAHPVWSQAVDSLQYARPEPALASWELVRWSVFDAGTQLFRSYFSVDQVPQLIQLLQDTAAELNRRYP